MRCFNIISALFLFLTFSSSQAFANHNIKHFKDVEWAKPKGFSLTLDIAIPETKTKTKPVLVIFHGGGWLLNNKSIMTDLANSIATRTDIITVNVNYRLLADVDNTTTVNEIVEDAMGAVLWVKDNIKAYGGNPDQIAVTGDSAGGHLAAMVAVAGRNLDSDGFTKKPLGFNPTYLPKGITAEQVAKKDGLKIQAAILSYAGFSLVEVAKRDFEGEGNQFWKWAKATPRGMFGGKINVNDNPEYYQAVSPDQYLVKANEYRLPKQFVHVGERDALTTPERAKAYVEQLKTLDQPVQFKIYQGKGHGFLDSNCNDYNNGCFKDLSEPTVTDMIDFLNKVFGL
ncbi:MAG: alpha/beta hydrolase [Cellvibrio sp.]|uniref:alpha/beta hydrolase n=1 Tax=Cellvibrio sp. TaxID=1965322 RepID=UPI0031A70EEE